MSFSEQKRTSVILYLIEKIAEGRKDAVKATAESFAISLNTVYRYLRELEQDGTIKKEGRRYTLIKSHQLFHLEREKGELESEDQIFNAMIRGEVSGLPRNVYSIWSYVFSEMMNNAIDHSGAGHVSIEIIQSFLDLSMVIRDDGIGLFRKIQMYYGYASEEEALEELFKGKLTTDSLHHSGEGIFFSSRAMDIFAAVSHGRIFSHDRYDDVVREFPDSELMEGWETANGTMIFMTLSKRSNRILKDVFDAFATVDGGFFKTQICLRNMFDLFPVSRSQAKRLYRNFDKFKEVELDFDGIEEIGQGFAHELFVVFPREHPNVRLSVTGAGETVQMMIRHVTVES